ncbi:carboxypeptidase-like regulatory domain-containing protein [Hymenobacter oligotrophus]|nr:carboxypeptidase-like regulatory domain-containing protein [Hymenobacter oligotrophus]
MKTTSLARALRATLVAGVLCASAGCDKQPISKKPDPQNPTEATPITTDVYGVVLDEQDQPVAGAVVEVGGRTLTTGSTGTFAFRGAEVPSDRCVVHVRKAGFFEAAVGVVPNDKGTGVRVMLTATGTPLTLASAAAGGTLQLPGGGSIEFAANSLQTSSGSYTGPVSAFVRYISPESPRLAQLMPGNDFQAENTAGERVTLTTFGAMQVELQASNGQQVQVATGKTATLHFPIAASQSSSAAATIPLWHFDTATGLWEEEGSARRSGSEYVGAVSHFSAWNADQADRTAYVKFGVRAAGLTELPDEVMWPLVRVRRLGQVLIPGANRQMVVPVPAGNYSGGPDDVWADPADNGGVGSLNRLSLGNLAPGQTLDLGQLQMPEGGIVQAEVLGCNSSRPNGVATLRFDNGGVYVANLRNGALRTWCLPGQAATLTITAEGYAPITQRITTPSGNRTLQVGSFNACGTTQAPVVMAFTIDGDGHHNERVELRDEPQYYDKPQAFFEPNFPTGAATTLLMGRSTRPGYVTATLLAATAPGLGTFAARTGSVAFNLNAGTSPGIYYEVANSADVSISLTRYDAVGGRVQGTFSGKFYKRIGTGPRSSTESVQITNGTFDMVRTANKP